MTLHDAIITVLKEKGSQMSYEEIANVINKEKLYLRRDKELLQAFQVRLRTFVQKKYKPLFIVDDERGTVSLSK